MTPSNNQAPLPPSDTPEQANKDTFKHAISYIPFVALVLFVVEKDKTPLLKKHISYGVILLFGYLITSTIVSIV